MAGHTHRSEDTNKYPCETNDPIGDEVLVGLRLPQDNYKCMDGNGLGNNGAKSL